MAPCHLSVFAGSARERNNGLHMQTMPFLGDAIANAPSIRYKECVLSKKIYGEIKREIDSGIEYLVILDV